ncbi:hypothetical protein C5167_035446, partial [Papaver somniferum]
GGDATYRKAWRKICQVSLLLDYQQTYDRLGVTVFQKVLSSYWEGIPEILKGLEKDGYVQDSSNGCWIQIGGGDPLLAVKSNGDYNNALIDLAALWHYLKKENAEWIVHMSDNSLIDYTQTIFAAAEHAGWLGECEKQLTHVGYGLVLGGDKKELAGSSSTLLDKAKRVCREYIDEMEMAARWTWEEREQIADVIGCGAIKYNDLKNDHSADYMLSLYDILSNQGDTGVSLQFALACARSVISKSGAQDVTIELDAGRKSTEGRLLGLQLIKFAEVIQEAVLAVRPSVLCRYLYDLSLVFRRYYKVQVEAEVKTDSILLLCEATAIVMEKCFDLLGVQPARKLERFHD